MKKMFNVTFCNNHKLSSRDFDSIGEYNPCSRFHMGYPLVPTLEEAMRYGTAFVGWATEGEWANQDILGLYDRGVFVLYWAAYEYVAHTDTNWTRGYTLTSDDQLARISKLALLYNKSYKNRETTRPGWNNWSELAYALRTGKYYANYGQYGWPEYMISDIALEVVEDITLPRTESTKRLAEAYVMTNGVDFEDAYESLNRLWVELHV